MQSIAPTTLFVRSETDRLEDVQALLEGRVFHVTRESYWPRILETGAILPNADGLLPTTFGASRNSYFRTRGCVSLFDYRLPLNDDIRHFRSCCWPFQPAGPGGEGVAILLLKPTIQERLLSWDGWSKEQALQQMIVPYIEAGHKGPIATDEIEQVLIVRLTEDPTSHTAAMRRALARGPKGADSG